uniref:RRM domain-containing protein n=1 Tax=Corethron hystrix TaxID=216773 RepID=A0A7S1BPG2_9STRA|mmetsp:Transcript_36013/g.84086  ORF Transcript_36013/g.84086 Transcript_36013/m.84086 type:complete len:762 (+) Transcript_36013:983-3268(+)
MVVLIGDIVISFRPFTQMADSNKVPDSDPKKKQILVYRRCVLLTVLGSTPGSDAIVANLIVKGYLNSVKVWLEDILSGSVGGIDLLLHLLNNIVYLPVTSDSIASSKIGKAVVGIKKHSICTSSANESTIKDLVNDVRDEWKTLVESKKKVKKADSIVPDSSKRLRDEDPVPVMSANPLTKKVRSSNTNLRASDLLRMNDTLSKGLATTSPKASVSDSATGALSKTNKRITWADSSGEPLTTSSDGTGRENLTQTSDENKDGMLDMESKASVGNNEIATILAMLDDMGKKTPALSSWKNATVLPPSDTPLPQVVSEQLSEQARRNTMVAPCGTYLAGAGIPNSVAMTMMENNIEMNVYNSTVSSTIPFSPPMQVVQPTVISASPPIAPPVPISVAPPTNAHLPSLVTPPSAGATLEMVQSMGLPLFLIGSNMQVLQNLAANPTLLSTFRNQHDGQFDQMRLLSFVQVMSGNQQPIPAPQAVAPLQHMYPNSSLNLQSAQTLGQNIAPPPFSAPPTINFSSNNYQTTNNRPTMSKYRGDTNSDGNLHLSGYGPSTTKEDIIALFAPYVRVDEVVMKSNFSFVNTSDPMGANLAREHLAGSFLGGAPIRINSAVRKAPDPSHKDSQLAKMSQIVRQKATPLPTNSLGQIDLDQVRDDRGNPATKNLFVAGYGPGTNEQDLREAFARIVTVVSVVKKNEKFAFVNTTDREAAVEARNSLMGTVVNGGVLRINFAKESGRLGTSFDTTYGPSNSAKINRYGYPIR